MRGSDLVRGIDAIDHWPDQASGNQGQNVGGEPVDGVRFFLDRAGAKDRSNDGGAFAEEQAQVDFGGPAGRGPDTDDASKRRERFEVGGEISATDEVEYDIDARDISPGAA